MHMHREHHCLGSVNWLRAAVLGMNDGLLSTASLVIGVAAAHGSGGSVTLAGMAGIVAGAFSMATGEYVSVSSQEDAEGADLARERAELTADPEGERQELADIYVSRGLSPDLARQVAVQLMARNALEAHARDELGIMETLSANPLQAAIASAISFAVGGLIPLLVALALPASYMAQGVFAASILALCGLGAVAAKLSGANIVRGALRVVVWGILAMAATSLAGKLFGAKG
jgi:vacuolar iron transporter family protein